MLLVSIDLTFGGAKPEPVQPPKDRFEAYRLFDPKPGTELKDMLGTAISKNIEHRKKQPVFLVFESECNTCMSNLAKLTHPPTAANSLVVIVSDSEDLVKRERPFCKNPPMHLPDMKKLLAAKLNASWNPRWYLFDGNLKLVRVQREPGEQLP